MTLHAILSTPGFRNMFSDPDHNVCKEDQPLPTEGTLTDEIPETNYFAGIAQPNPVSQEDSGE